MIDGDVIPARVLPSNPSTRERDEVRITVAAHDFVRLAQRRARLAACSLPALVVVGCGTLALSLSLALVAVLCVFFGYAAVTIARRERMKASAATEIEVIFRGDEIRLPGCPPRRIFRAVNRPDYLRLIFTRERVAALWLDDRRDPTAFFDLPTSSESRVALCKSLLAAGVEITREGSAERVIVLVGSLALALFTSVVARVAFKMSVVAIIASPLTWCGVVLLSVVVFWSWRRRA